MVQTIILCILYVKGNAWTTDSDHSPLKEPKFMFSESLFDGNEQYNIVETHVKDMVYSRSCIIFQSIL